MNPQVTHLEQLVANKKIQKAIHLCEQLINEDPPYIELIYYQLGQALATSKQWQAAAKAYSQALKSKPNFVNAAIALGHATVALKAYPQAEQNYSHALSIAPILAPQIAMGFKQLADSLVKEQQYKMAVMAYFNAFNLDRALAQQIIVIFKQLKRQKVIKQSPSLLVIVQQHLKKVQTAFDAIKAETSLDWHNAIQAWETAVQTNSTEEWAYERLWFILEHQNQLETAQKRYIQHIKKAPSSPVLQVCLAGVLVKLGEFSQAFAAYQAAKEQAFYPDWIHKRMIGVLLELSRLEDAKQEIQQYFPYPSQKTQVLAGLANIANHSQQFELALEHWQAIRQLEPHSIPILLSEAQTLMQLNHYAKATVLLDSALFESPNHPQILQSLAALAV